MAFSFGLAIVVCLMVVGLNGQETCVYKGNKFQAFSKVYSYYDQSKNWCNVGICKADGTIWRLVDLSCQQAMEKSSTTASPLAKTTATTTTTIGTVTESEDCQHEGKRYSHGTEIYRGIETSKNTCYLQVCVNGEVVMRNRKCQRNTTPAPTETTTVAPTTVPGCFYNDKHYPLDSEIERGYDASSNWCYGTNCDSYGQIEHWDNFHCYQTTTPTSPVTSRRPEPPQTSPPTTTPPSPPTTIPQEELTTLPHRYGCYEDGKFFAPGEKMSEGYDEWSDWCYGVYCNERGEKINWDTWDCKKRGRTTIPPQTTSEEPTWPPTTLPLTTTMTTAPFGCYYDGRRFAPGSEISQGYDEYTDWCYGALCDNDGHVLQWDSWNCKKKSSTTEIFSIPTTTEPITPRTTPATTEEPTTATTTEVPPTTTLSPEHSLSSELSSPVPSEAITSEPGCLFDGAFYPVGKAIYDRWSKETLWCYGLICHQNNKLVHWEQWNCSDPTTTSMPRITFPPENEEAIEKADRKYNEKAGCIYNGKSFSNNQFIVKKCDQATKKCSMLFCDRFGRIVPKLITDITRQKEISKQNLRIQSTKEKLLKED